MDARAFFQLVADLRDVQKGYFATPAAQYRQKQELLQQSKRLEAQVDAEIKRVRDIIARTEYERQNPPIPGFDIESFQS